MREPEPLAVYLHHKNINLHEALETVKNFSEKKNLQQNLRQEIIAKISPNNTCPDFTHEQKKIFFKTIHFFFEKLHKQYEYESSKKGIYKRRHF